MASDTRQSDQDDVDVIEAEFVDAPGEQGRARPRWGLRIGWGLAAVLAVFIAGLLMAAHVERGLAWFGLSLPRLAEPQAQGPPATATSAQDLSEVLAGFDRLDRRIAALESTVSEIDRAVDDNRDSIAALRTRPEATGNGVAQAPAVTAADFESLVSRLTVLDDRVQALASQVADAPAPVSEGEITALQNALSAAEDARRRLAGRLDSIDRRLGVVETARRSQQARPSLALVLPGLAQAVDRGRPFVAELAAARDVLDGAAGPVRMAALPLVETLGEHADTGVDSQTDLTGDFPAMARAVQAAGPGPADEADGFWSTLGRRLGSVISVRRVDEAAEGRDRFLADAEAALARGDLAGAVTALERLEGDARAAASDWIGRARARLAAISALEDLIALARPDAQGGTIGSAGPPAGESVNTTDDSEGS